MSPDMDAHSPAPKPIYQFKSTFVSSAPWLLPFYFGALAQLEQVFPAHLGLWLRGVLPCLRRSFFPEHLSHIDDRVAILPSGLSSTRCLPVSQGRSQAQLSRSIWLRLNPIKQSRESTIDFWDTEWCLLEVEADSWTRLRPGGNIISVTEHVCPRFSSSYYEMQKLLSSQVFLFCVYCHSIIKLFQSSPK